MSEELRRPMSEARKKANAKFKAAAYDRLELNLPKGQKEVIREHAEQYQLETGEIGVVGYSPRGSMTGFISRAISETMVRDKAVGSFTVRLTDDEL